MYQFRLNNGIRQSLFRSSGPTDVFVPVAAISTPSCPWTFIWILLEAAFDRWDIGRRAEPASCTDIYSDLTS